MSYKYRFWELGNYVEEVDGEPEFKHHEIFPHVDSCCRGLVPERAQCPRDILEPFDSENNRLHRFCLATWGDEPTHSTACPPVLPDMGPDTLDVNYFYSTSAVSRDFDPKPPHLGITRVGNLANPNPDSCATVTLMFLRSGAPGGKVPIEVPIQQVFAGGETLNDLDSCWNGARFQVSTLEGDQGRAVTIQLKRHVELTDGTTWRFLDWAPGFGGPNLLPYFRRTLPDGTKIETLPSAETKEGEYSHTAALYEMVEQG